MVNFILQVALAVAGPSHSIWEVFEHLLLEADAAEPGNTGLLVVGRQDWDSFYSVSKQESAPGQTVDATVFAALPGLHDEDVVVVPGLLGSRRSLAFWEVQEDYGLDVVVDPEVPPDSDAESVVSRMQSMQLPLVRWRRPPPPPCKPRTRPRFECYGTKCAGGCKPVRFFDDKLQIPMVSCWCPKK